MARKPVISIIGPGRVGTTLGILAARNGYEVVVGARVAAKARAAAKAMGRRAAAAGVDEAAAAGGIVLLTVTDAAIAPLCEQLASQGAFTPGAIVAHCCGALASDVLEPAKRLCGCHIASMHPLQTFPTPQAGVAAIKDTPFFLEGDATALRPLEKLVRNIGGSPLRLSGGPRGKALYHAAACMASNYLVALMDAALTVAQEAGIDRRQAWVALAPLIEATLNNITVLGPAGALTGPISRGDAGTVARHLDAIGTIKPPAAGRALADFYRAMGLRTVELSGRKKSISAAQARELRRVLAPGS